jgi:methionyl-tRNA formyltransferase
VTKLTTAFAGSPDFAKTILKRLQNSAFAPSVILTQPDRPKGRGRKLTSNPVKVCAQAANTPILQPKDFKSQENVDALAKFRPDVLIVAAYGLILPAPVLDLPRFGCINVHASLLPRWRGAAPIERAIIAGDRETGVSIMQMEAGLDTGPIYNDRKVPIVSDASVLELEQTLANVGAELLIEVLNNLPMASHPQNSEGVTYAAKLSAADRTVNWQSSASDIERQIRALAQRTPVTVTLPNVEIQLLEAEVLNKESATTIAARSKPGTLVQAKKNILLIQCGTGRLQIKQLRLNKGKGLPLGPSAVINGFQRFFPEGAVFDDEGADQ